MNYKIFGILMAICICLVAVETIVVGVSAEENGSYVVVYMEDNQTDTLNLTKEEPAYNNTRITQGQCVEIGGVYDVSGVIGFTTTLPFNAFAYYGRYENAFDPYTDIYNLTDAYVYQMPDKRSSYYNFYIDPTIFENRQGYWYQFTGTYERGANKRAFYVSDKCIKPISNTTSVVVNNTPTLLNPRAITPRHISDIVLSNDDPLYLDVPETKYSLWAFGYGSTMLLDVPLNLDSNSTEKLIFDRSVSQKLYTGNYNIILQHSGNNKKYDVAYSTNNRGTDGKNLLIPESRSIDIVDVTGLSPKLVEENLLRILDQTDDTYTTYAMEVQEPYIEINAYNEIYLDGVGGNRSLLEVTGYTNKIANTPITLYYDRESTTKQSLKYPSMTVLVDDGDVGDYRTFHGYLPLNYDDMAPGLHTLSAVLPSGASTSLDFYIREELKPHYEEPTVYNFIDGDPYYIPPTPVIVEKEVIKEVTKVVIETETVYIPVDYNTLAQETLNKAIPIVVACVLIGIPIIYGCLLAIRVYAERRIKKLSDEVKE